MQVLHVVVAVMALGASLSLFDADAPHHLLSAHGAQTRNSARMRHPLSQRIELPEGFTRYALEGPADGELVVLLHGFSIASDYVLGGVSKALAEQGYRVLSFDWYGRGGSDAPHAKYTAGFHVSQAVALLAALDLAHEPFHVYGVSMGGLLAVRMAELYPAKVKSLFLVAPAGLPVIVPWTVHLLKIPVFGRAFFELMGVRLMNDKMRHEFSDDTLDEQVLATSARYQDEQAMRTPGYVRALLSTLDNLDMGGFTKSYRAVGRFGPSRPVTLFWGEMDNTCPFKNAATVQELVPHAKLVSEPKAGHLISATHRDKLIKTLLAHLRQ